jgi:uncharacterized protein YdbL (DUF1318 family)
MKFLKYLTSSLVTGLMLVSCVTINIYFPAAAAEKAADRIIEDVWGPEGLPQSVPDSGDGEDQSFKSDKQFNVALSVLNWFISPAAAEPDLNINSAAIAAIQKKMKVRHSLLKSFFANGAVGLSSQGLLAIHNVKAVSLKDRNKVKGFIADENKDRMALYGEIARANGHPEWQSDIQATFSRRWVDKAAKGWWYQSGDSWQQK